MLPLQDKCILVTRSPNQSHQFSQSLRQLGAKVVEMPTIIITPPDSWAELDQAIAHLAEYHWLLFTSVNGVESFCGRLALAGKNYASLSHLKIAAVGEKTAQHLSQFGMSADIVPDDFIADSLVAIFQNQQLIKPQTKILFPRVQSGGREVLVQELSKMGAIVHAVPAYESRCPDHIDAIALEYLSSQKLDLITFASSKTVQNFCHLLNQVAEPAVWQNWIAHSKIISIGQQTSHTCQKLLGRVDAEAEVATMAGMESCILEFCNSQA